MSKKFIIVLIFAMGIIVSAQNPQINTISGTILDGEQITITGSNFGANGPSVILFDDFKRGVEDEAIALKYINQETT